MAPVGPSLTPITVNIIFLVSKNALQLPTTPDNYAGIFTCKETADVSYHSVTFWTRTGKALSPASIAHMKQVLDKYNFSYLYSTLENIPQDGQYIKWCSVGSALVEPATKILVPLLTKILG